MFGTYGSVFLFFGFISVCRGEFSKCGRDDGFNIYKLVLSPNPVEIPGTVDFTMHANLTRTLGSSKLEIWLKKKTFLGIDIPIPCLFNVGSCTYPDLCTMLDNMISQNWAGIMRGIGEQIQGVLTAQGIDPSQCSLPPRAVRIDNAPMRLPEMPLVFYWFATGDYHAKVKVTENVTGRQIICVVVRASVVQKAKQSGWFFG